MNIGERIALIREKENLNQEAFGKRINVTRSAISNYEKGTRNVMDRVIFDICREFNVNEEWLRNGVGEMFLPTPNDELKEILKKYKVSDKQYKFLYEYLKLDFNKRETLVEFLENLVNNETSSATVDTSESLIVKEDNTTAKENPTISSYPIEKDTNNIDSEVAAFREELIAESKGETLSVSERQEGA